jgi:flagellar motility protein MotE (MotC chaperone)
MNISNNMASVVIQAILDAIKFNQSLLESETLRDIEDHEEYLMTLGTLLQHVSDEYKKVENETGILLSKLIPKQS